MAERELGERLKQVRLDAEREAVIRDSLQRGLRPEGNIIPSAEDVLAVVAELDALRGERDTAAAGYVGLCGQLKEAQAELDGMTRQSKSWHEAYRDAEEQSATYLQRALRLERVTRDLVKSAGRLLNLCNVAELTQEAWVEDVLEKARAAQSAVNSPTPAAERAEPVAWLVVWFDGLRQITQDREEAERWKQKAGEDECSVEPLYAGTGEPIE